MSDSDANVRQALREVKKHGQERDLLVALLREQARPCDIAFDGLPVSVSARQANPMRGAFNIVQGRHVPMQAEDDHIAVFDEDALALILDIARFLPTEPTLPGSDS